MPYTPGANEAMSQGVNHAVNPGRGNAGSITMADSGMFPDWPASTSAHSVLSTTPGADSSGIDYEGMQRLSGNFNSPGAMGKFQDALSGGADDTTIEEE